MLLFGKQSIAVAHALIPVILAMLIGLAVLLPLHKSGKLPGRVSLALALALGWGMLSLFVILLTTLSQISGIHLLPSELSTICTIAAVGLTIVNRHQLREEFRIRFEANRGPTSSTAMQCLILIVALLGMLFFWLLQLQLALIPSIMYDVLEYHLPVIQQIIAQGSLAPIQGNAYTLMPKAAESLYAFGVLFNDNIAIDQAAKLTNLMLAWSAVFVLHTLLSQFRLNRNLRLLALLLFLAHPIRFTLLTDLFVGMPIAMFLTAALICWKRARENPNQVDPILAAIFLGFAFSCKYPTLGVAVLPFLILLAPSMTGALFGKQKTLKPHHYILTVIILGAIIDLIYSPWLLRALYYDASPFPPLTHAWFGSTPNETSLALRQFMAEKHAMSSPFRMEYIVALLQRWRIPGALCMLSTLAVLFWPRAKRDERLLAIFVISGYVVWNLVPNGADRFLAPLLPALCLLCVLFLRQITCLLPNLGFLIALPFALWIFTLGKDQFLDSKQLGFFDGLEPQSYLEQKQGVTGRFFSRLNATTSDQPNSRVLLLYEARSGWVHSSNAPISNTVFDISTLWEILRQPEGNDPQYVLQQLRNRGVTYLAVNEIELARLLYTYPASEALNDPQYIAMRNQPLEAPVYPGYLNLARFYPPYYYSGGEQVWKTTAPRLQRLLAYLYPQRIYGETIFGCRIWFVAI